MNGTFPLQNDTVDAVFLNAVLEHLDNPNEVIAEAARVLRPGGRIVMTTPTRMAKPVLEFLAYTLHVINEDEIREHKHYFNKSDINNLVAAINGADTSALVSLERYSFFELGLNSLIVLRKI